MPIKPSTGLGIFAIIILSIVISVSLIYIYTPQQPTYSTPPQEPKLPEPGSAGGKYSNNPTYPRASDGYPYKDFFDDKTITSCEDLDKGKNAIYTPSKAIVKYTYQSAYATENDEITIRDRCYSTSGTYSTRSDEKYGISEAICGPSNEDETKIIPRYWSQECPQGYECKKSNDAIKETEEEYYQERLNYWKKNANQIQETMKKINIALSPEKLQEEIERRARNDLTEAKRNSLWISEASAACYPVEQQPDPRIRPTDLDASYRPETQ